MHRERIKKYKSPYRDRKMSTVVHSEKRKYSSDDLKSYQSVKIFCPACLCNNTNDIIRLRAGFYCCRKCGEEFIDDNIELEDK